MRLIVLLSFAGCTNSAPPVVSVVPPAPPERTLTLSVPRDCPHLMVSDILSTEGGSDVTVACFGPYSDRTYLHTAKGPPVGIENESDTPARLIIEFVSRNEIDDPFVEP